MLTFDRQQLHGWPVLTGANGLRQDQAKQHKGNQTYRFARHEFKEE